LPSLPGECVGELYQAIVEVADDAVYDGQAIPQHGRGTPGLEAPERAWREPMVGIMPMQRCARMVGDRGCANHVHAHLTLARKK
jgi:hypothetical protein